MRRAWSKLRTAPRNWGEATIWRSVSSVGGAGRSGGRCGKSACVSSGCVLKSGPRVAGVRMSVREISVEGGQWVEAWCGGGSRGWGRGGEVG